MGQHIASLEWNDVRTPGLLRPRAALPALCNTTHQCVGTVP
eukprot:CAMPEP_0177770720 /NCGR_PEP_ID=MMETSP0491_2-20121128/11108_1 /TAXON_ID=63592 /ORGANISM="Tetraselmis chuii, Strain PLY429" /LENGTH=40 /DNA_ID= /DNA_START= /DNA_END= /DNA_ORIENTATION=